MNNKHIISGILTCALFVFVISLHSGCANTSAAPAGGPKDSIPPTLVATLPDINATHVSTTLKRAYLEFNEYVKLVDANKYLLLSPPPEKNPTARTKGKGIAVDFLRDLDSNTTYCLYFGSAIQDNNEGNQFPTFALSFSTGDYIDSLMYSGIVVDASTLLPLDNATVMLYLNPVDSTLTKCRPVAATRTDAYGYFTVRNLKDTLYTLYAITDDNNNFKYDPTSGEKVAFMDSLVRPTKVMFTYAPEIQPYFLEDTAGLLRRPIETGIYSFKELSTRQVLRGKTRLQKRALEFKFGAPDARIDHIEIDGIDSTELIRQDNFLKDSIIYWITADKVPDTLNLRITYWRTNDSLLTLEPGTDTLRIDPYVEPENKQGGQQGSQQSNPQGQQRANPQSQGGGGGNRSTQKQAPSTQPKRETLSMKVSATPELIETNGITLTFNSYPIKVNLDTLILQRISADKKDTLADTFTYKRDTLDPKIYTIHPSNYLEGTDYIFTIQPNVFEDINRLPNDSLVTKFTTPKSDDFGALHLELTNISSPIIIDLMNDARTTVQRTLTAYSDTTLSFKYLKEGKYALRFTEDLNQNGQWDTGNVTQKRQAEKVRVYKYANGSSVIELKEKMELTQSIDVNLILNQNVTLTKPDKASSGNKR